MRKIETEMNQAIRNGHAWSKDNTCITYDPSNGMSAEVYLHGNHIATYFHDTRELQLFDGGWQTVTTKSRLNALCDEFAVGHGVFQKNWQWFISDRFSGINIPFISGTSVK